MPLVGQAFVILWHDITAEADAQYNLWHTREHMPERIALPGFLRARRGVNRALDHQVYSTLYEGDALETFVSKAYFDSLNFPTAWTTRVAPQFRNFLRMACEIVSTAGTGVGGALATFRFMRPDGRDEAATLAAVATLVDPLLALDEVTGVHVGAARPDYCPATRETELRPAMQEVPFEVVLIVEGIGLAELAAREGDIVTLLKDAGLGVIVQQSYDMAYLLGRNSA